MLCSWDTLEEEQTVLLLHYVRPDLAEKGTGRLGGPLLQLLAGTMVARDIDLM